LKLTLLFALAAAAFGQTAEVLRSDVSYLASPQLEGRDTPSHGLDLAADFIARKFQAAGLQPADHGSYFQEANHKKGLRNVVAILPGADPVLRNQYVILSAHYDHVGRNRNGIIFPGANDNASGTASVVEIAAVLAARPERPRRSILFIAFYGEEKGLLGSSYYVTHPLVPLNDTVAVINLEQLGRMDDPLGWKTAAFAMTGTSFSNLTAMIDPAVSAAGVKIYHRADEDDYFNRSDNYPFASKGVVDTTFVVAFEFGDYHGPGDTADKIDYDNLATVDRGVEAAVLEVANSANRPVWTRSPPPGRK
jgi:Zn-dependent M28 family amino/carboxypeptidase